jgi:PAS domain S-box-containing protein
LSKTESKTPAKLEIERLEAALEAAENRCLLLTRSMETPVFELDVDARVIDVTSRARDFATPSGSFLELLHADHHRGCLESIQEALTYDVSTLDTWLVRGAVRTRRIVWMFRALAGRSSVLVCGRDDTERALVADAATMALEEATSQRFRAELMLEGARQTISKPESGDPLRPIFENGRVLLDAPEVSIRYLQAPSERPVTDGDGHTSPLSDMNHWGSLVEPTSLAIAEGVREDLRRLERLACSRRRAVRLSKLDPADEKSDMLCVPVEAGNEVVATVTFRRHDQLFSDEDVELIAGFCELGTLAFTLHQTRDKLAANERLWRSIFERNGAVQLLIAPDDGRIIASNEAAAAFYGYSRQALCDMTIWNLCSGGADHMAQCFSHHGNGHAPHCTVPHRLANGDIRDCEVWSSRITVDGHTLIYAQVHDTTARHRAERALSRSEAERQAVVESAPVGLLLLSIDDDTLIVDEANPAAWSALDVDIAERGKRPAAQLAPELFSDELSTKLRDIARDGGRFREQQLEVERGESRLVFDLQATRASIGRVVVGLVDVTDRHRDQMAMQQLKQQTEMILESAGQGIFGIDPDGRFTFVNAAAARFLGYEAEELLGADCHALTHAGPVGVPHLRECCPILTACREGKACRTDDDTFRRKTGETFPVEYVSTPIWVGDDKPVGAVVVFDDITDRRRAEMQLRQLGMAIEQSHDTVVIMNPQGVVSYVNEAFVRATGYARHEVLGQRYLDSAPGKVDEEGHLALSESMAGCKSWHGRVTQQRKDGSELVEDVSFSPVRNRSGELVNFVAVKRDVSLEVDLSTKLVEAEKMQAIGLLAGGLAHDINNILATVLIAAHACDENPGTTEGTEALQNIITACHRGRSITRSLLSFAGKARPEREAPLAQRHHQRDAFAARSDLARSGDRLRLRPWVAPGRSRCWTGDAGHHQHLPQRG